MNILLLGYGKMGKTIEKIATDRGHSIVGKIDDPSASRDNFNSENTDVAIEFSQPSAAVDNIRWCLENNIPIVSGTTGWLDKFEEMRTICENNKSVLFYASNYSLGVNIFFRLNAYLARMMEHADGYEVLLKEIHHLQKLDSPSGTAITLAEGILAHLSKKTSWNEGKTADTSVLEIEALREPDVPGTHQVSYESAEDRIDIIHTAHSRQGFALGAVLVAEWIPGRTGVLGMDDFLDF